MARPTKSGRVTPRAKRVVLPAARPPARLVKQAFPYSHHRISARRAAIIAEQIDGEGGIE